MWDLAQRLDFMLMAGLHNILGNAYCPNALVPKLFLHLSMSMTNRTEENQVDSGKKRTIRLDNIRARQGRT